MRANVIDLCRAAFMAACCLVLTAEAAQAQLPAIRVNGPFPPQPAEPSVFEGDPAGPAVTLNFTVELSAVPTQAVSVSFSTFTLNSPGGNAVSAASCATAGADFIGIVNQTVAIPANANPPTATVPVTVCRDNQVEFHQNFAQQTREDIGVMLTNPVNAVCSGSQCVGFGHIFDDDGTPTGVINSVTTREPFSGTKTATFTVTLSHPHPGEEVRIGWETRNGSARGASACAPFVTGGFADYRSNSGTLTFAPDDMSETLQITICSDPVDESTQTYFVDLTSQTNNVFLADATGTGSILNFELPQFTGTFTLDPEGADVRAGDWLTYRFQWTITAGVWRDLKTMELRVRQRGTRKIPLWIRWVESTNTFQLCHGRDDDSDDDDESKRWTGRRDLKAKCGPPVVAGSPHVLNAPLARLDVAGAKAIGSGPTGPSVTLELPVSFKRGAAHHTYDVEVAAESDAGVRDDFTTAGVLVVRR